MRRQRHRPRRGAAGRVRRRADRGHRGRLPRRRPGHRDDPPGRRLGPPVRRRRQRVRDRPRRRRRRAAGARRARLRRPIADRRSRRSAYGPAATNDPAALPVAAGGRRHRPVRAGRDRGGGRRRRGGRPDRRPSRRPSWRTRPRAAVAVAAGDGGVPVAHVGRLVAAGGPLVDAFRTALAEACPRARPVTAAGSALDGARRLAEAPWVRLPGPSPRLPRILMLPFPARSLIVSCQAGAESALHGPGSDGRHGRRGRRAAARRASAPTGRPTSPRSAPPSTCRSSASTSWATGPACSSRPRPTRPARWSRPAPRSWRWTAPAGPGPTAGRSPTRSPPSTSGTACR